MSEVTNLAESIKQPAPDHLSSVRRRLSPLVWKRFIPSESQPANPTELPEVEVQKKCFEVLGFLEEYYRPSVPDTVEIKDTDEDIPRKKNGLKKLEEQLDSVLHSKPAGDTQEHNRTQHQENLQQRLSQLLAIPQVKDRFEKEFNEELPQYEAARGLMRQVRDIDRVTGKLRQAIYRKYLGDKQQHGKLTQSSVEQIYFFQQKLDELELQEKGIKGTASPSALGYLETQKLVDYKRQLKEKGFVMTPSREHLIDRITREALAGKKIFLVGSTGTGKTQLAFYALNNLTGGYELINWHEGTTPRDLFGYRELWTDELGGVQSGMKPGPIPKALEKQVGVIHEEYTGGSTRTQLAAKFMMGARPGDRIKIPGFNGQVFDVTNNFIEIFTGNPKDERTKQREDMDPAILRELTGVEVSYMPVSEMNDIIRSMLIEENGVLKLSVSETEYIERLTKAAEMMQRIHNRDFEGFSTEMRTLLGIDAQGNTDATLNTNFLDPGTLFKLFGEWELASARGKKFADYMTDKLREFITDPKTLSTPEERRTLQKILHTFGLITSSTANIQVEIPHQDKGYILPSEMAGKVKQSENNPMGGKTKGAEASPVVFEWARDLFKEKFFGVEAVEKAFGVSLSPDQIPDVANKFTSDELERYQKLGMRLELRINKAKDGSFLTMRKISQDLQDEFTKSNKGNVLYGFNPSKSGAWYENDPVFKTETPKAEWVVVSDNILPGSTGKNYLEQTELLENFIKDTLYKGEQLPTIYQEAIDEFEQQKVALAPLMIDATWKEAADRLAALKINKLFRHTPVEVIYDMVMMVQNTGQRFLPDKWTWTNVQAQDGYLVFVGGSDTKGARVNDGHPHRSLDYLGVAFSR